MPTDAPKSILVVDDDSVTRGVTAATLRAAGYTVAVATDGKAALEYLHSHPPPALIIVDMMMPVMDGWEFMRQRKQDAALESIPVLLATGVPLASDDWAESLGAEGLIQQPCERDELIAAIRFHLGS